MVANAMLRPAGNPVYYVQPPGMSHRELKPVGASWLGADVSLANISRITASLSRNTSVSHLEPSGWAA
jgi:hypothetical protein